MRLQVLVTAEEKKAFREMAEREGISLSAWMRQAGLCRLAECKRRKSIGALEELRAFFDACDRRETGAEREWVDHKDVIHRSLRSGSSDT